MWGQGTWEVENVGGDEGEFDFLISVQLLDVTHMV